MQGRQRPKDVATQQGAQVVGSQRCLDAGVLAPLHLDRIGIVVDQGGDVSRRWGRDHRGAVESTGGDHREVPQVRSGGTEGDRVGHARGEALDVFQQHTEVGTGGPFVARGGVRSHERWSQRRLLRADSAASRMRPCRRPAT